jgi:hypothetical protein
MTQRSTQIRQIGADGLNHRGHREHGEMNNGVSKPKIPSSVFSVSSVVKNRCVICVNPVISVPSVCKKRKRI